MSFMDDPKVIDGYFSSSKLVREQVNIVERHYSKYSKKFSRKLG